MVKAFWERAFPTLMHPAIWQAVFISYWSRWQLGWVVASWAFLVGLSGLLYYVSLYAPQVLDILTLFRGRRQFLIFWQLLTLLGLRAATVEPIITYWLNFFLWHTALAWLGHWRWTFSLHAQGWAGLATFFLWYGRSYAMMAALCIGLWAIVAYQRWQTKAHTLSEVALGSIMGCAATVSYILM
jgi:hypothetical protein